MTTTMRVSMLASVALLAVAAGAPAQAQQANSMTFFVTSNGPGKAATSAGSPAPMPIAASSRKPRARPARPGTLISAPKAPAP